MSEATLADLIPDTRNARAGWIDWAQWDSELGQRFDNDLAKRIGCARTAVTYRRRSLGIAALRVRRKKRAAKLAEDDKKICTLCGCIKPLSEFYIDTRKPSQRRPRCKDCCNDIDNAKHARRKAHWVECLGGQCSNCGFSAWTSALEFHHVDERSEAHRTPSNWINNNLIDSKTVRQELDRCVLLCRNCHGAFHGRQLKLEFEKALLGWAVRK